MVLVLTLVQILLPKLRVLCALNRQVYMKGHVSVVRACLNVSRQTWNVATALMASYFQIVEYGGNVYRSTTCASWKVVDCSPLKRSAQKMHF